MADFSQPQREALIRLLLAATYGDDRLSIDENDAFGSMIDALPWDSGTEIGLFRQEATAAVREAHEAGSLEAFIREQAEAFDSPATRATALDLFVRLMDSDDTTAAEGKLVALATGLLR